MHKLQIHGQQKVRPSVMLCSRYWSRVAQKSSFWATLSQFLFLSPGYLTIYLNMGESGGKDASFEFLEERQDTARCTGKYQ